METKQYAAAGPWISVEEALPDTNEGIYLVRYGDEAIALAMYNDIKYYMGHGGLPATHWAEVRV